MSLQAQTIVITRSVDQSKELAKQFTQLGAKPILFPCIQISIIDSNVAWQALQPPPEKIDCAFFVSVNAAKYGLQPLQQHVANIQQIAAVGSATAKQLQSMGMANVVLPQNQFDSEGLLALPQFQQLAGKDIVIIKGVGGRTLLNETLTTRGANVYSIDVYRRDLPSDNDASLLKQTLDLILFFSKEGVDNMLQITPTALHPQLFNCQTLVGHPSIATKVTSLGFKKLPIIASNPTDAEMLAATVEWANHREIHNE